MLPLYDLAKLIFTTLGQGLVGWTADSELVYFPIMIAFVLAIVLRQHLRQAKLEEHLFGAPFSTPITQVLTSLGFGLLGGFAASMLMVSMGIALSMDTGIQYVWPVVLFMMLINPRFMCFAYGGGVVGAFALLLRALSGPLPQIADVPFLSGIMGLDIPALMALVGLLHLTESLLIYVSGHLNASPIVVEGPDGKIVGGFMLQRFWPLPMAALLAFIVMQSEISGDGIGMPNWWPLLRPALEPGPGMTILFAPFPIVAALGYSDIAVSSTPREKSRWSAKNLLIYSIALLALALIAGQWRFLQILPVLFAPLAHEFLIQVGNSREWKNKPIFSRVDKGVMLLATLPNSPARDKGLDTGWIIHSVNGIDVYTRQQLSHALAIFPGLAELDVESPEGKQKTITLHQREGRLGLVPAPDGSEGGGQFLKIGGKGFIPRTLDKLRKKKSGH